QADDDVSMRVLADHARTTAFLIAEGVFPEKSAREYVLRRVMRRAIRHGHRLGIKKPFLHELTLQVVALMGDEYPELVQRKELIATVAEQEEVRFRETLDRGLKMLDEAMVLAKPTGIIEGEAAFKLYDTYGFPLDLTQVLASERGLEVDFEGYERALQAQRKRSEDSDVGEAAVEEVWRAALTEVQKGAPQGVRFVGYERETCEARVVALVKKGELVAHAVEGDEVSVVTDVTPFYGEAGGQMGDRGTLRGPCVFEVRDTQKPLTGLVTHLGKVSSGAVSVGDAVTLAVDTESRNATRRNHTATHLLHWALRTVLGQQATQKGSLVGPDRLRFDFAHGRGLSTEELASIEDRVNAKVLTNAPVLTEVLAIAEARKTGAMAIFEEKYGDVVRVLTMTSDSVELCGGTHARALGEIGLFKIVSEGSLAAGVRRIEAVTGHNALTYVRDLEGVMRAAARVVKGSVTELPEKLDKLVDRTRQLEKEVADLRRKVATGGGAGLDELVRGARDFAWGKALAVRLDGADGAVLRETAEKLRDKLGDSVVLVGAVVGSKASLVLAVSKGVTSRYSANELIKGVASKV
ncbi:MAG: alanine--tRNA ligase, partial [Myxococcales bacterium]